MKQGRASVVGMGGVKREPISRAVNPAAVADIGIMKGNHVMDTGDVPFKTRQMYEGRGLQAPMSGCAIHKAGSQGKR